LTCTDGSHSLYVLEIAPEMVKKLTKTGNSLALVFDKRLLDVTGIDADTPLEVSTDGQVIIVSPVRVRRRAARLRKIVAEAGRHWSVLGEELCVSPDFAAATSILPSSVRSNLDAIRRSTCSDGLSSSSFETPRLWRRTARVSISLALKTRVIERPPASHICAPEPMRLTLGSEIWRGSIHKKVRINIGGGCRSADRAVCCWGGLCATYGVCLSSRAFARS